MSTPSDASPAPLTLYARFACKAVNLAEVRREAPTDRRGSRLIVIAERFMSEAEYDAFAANLLADYDWLDGLGGGPDAWSRRVVRVSAPDRETLFVDPSGYRYARYVGLAISG